MDKTGRVSDVEAMTMKGTKLAGISVDAIKKGPDWVPVQVNGYIIRAYRVQPITLLKF